MKCSFAHITHHHQKDSDINKVLTYLDSVIKQTEPKIRQKKGLTKFLHLLAAEESVPTCLKYFPLLRCFTVLQEPMIING